MKTQKPKYLVAIHLLLYKILYTNTPVPIVQTTKFISKLPISKVYETILIQATAKSYQRINLTSISTNKMLNLMK